MDKILEILSGRNNKFIELDIAFRWKTLPVRLTLWTLIHIRFSMPMFEKHNGFMIVFLLILASINSYSKGFIYTTLNHSAAPP